MANKKTGDNTKKTVKKTTTSETIEPKIDKETIKKEIIEYINIELKEELNTHIDQQMKKKFVEVLERQHRKEIKEKNKKLLGKNILILLLIISVGCLLYLMYDNGFFDKYLHVNNSSETTKKEEKKEKPTVKEPTLDELKEKYSSLLNNYTLFDTSNYNEDFYNKNITDQLKLYFVFSSLNFKDLGTEDDYYLIDEDVIKNKYEELFNDSYKSTNFEYNTHRIRYFNKLKAYVSDNIFDKDTDNNIVREITNIKEDDGKVTITTIEGIVQDNILINPKTKELIDEEYNDNLLEYQDALETITYVFEDGKLVEIR